MSRIRKVIMLTLTLLLLTSCTNGHFEAYDEENYQDFIDKISLALNDLITPAVFIDLRTHGDESNPSANTYAASHIAYFINYDYLEIGKDKFQEAITYHYSQKHHLFLIDAEGAESSIVASLLREKGYKHIYYYTKGYNSIIELSEGQLVINTGNCDC